MKIFRCFFEYQTEIIYVDSQPDTPAYDGIQAFETGFWIDMNPEKGPTLSCNGNIWIAPASIKHIFTFEQH